MGLKEKAEEVREKKEKSGGEKKRKKPPEIEHTILRGIAEKTLNKSKITEKDLKKFRSEAGRYLDYGQLTEKDKKAVGNILKTLKKMEKEGKIKKEK